MLFLKSSKGSAEDWKNNEETGDQKLHSENGVDLAYEIVSSTLH